MTHDIWGRLIALLVGVALSLTTLLVYFAVTKPQAKSSTEELGANDFSTTQEELEAQEFAPLRMLAIAKSMENEHMKQMLIFATERAMKGYVFDYNGQPIQIQNEQLGKIVFGEEIMRAPGNGSPQFTWWLNQNNSKTSVFTATEKDKFGYDYHYHETVEDEWEKMLVRLGGENYNASYELLRLVAFAHEWIVQEDKQPESVMDRLKSTFESCQISHCNWSPDESDLTFAITARRISKEYVFTIHFTDTWAGKKGAARKLEIVFRPVGDEDI